MTGIAALSPHAATRPRRSIDTTAVGDAFGAAIAAASVHTPRMERPQVVATPDRNRDGGSNVGAVPPVADGQRDERRNDAPTSSEVARDVTPTPPPSTQAGTTTAAAATTSTAVATTTTAAATTTTAAGTTTSGMAPVAAPAMAPGATPNTASANMPGSPMAPMPAVLGDLVSQIASSGALLAAAAPGAGARSATDAAAGSPQVTSNVATPSTVPPAVSLRSQSDAASNGFAQSDRGSPKGAHGQSAAVPTTGGAADLPSASPDASATRISAAGLGAPVLPATGIASTPISQPSSVVAAASSDSSAAPHEQILHLVTPLRLAADGTYTLTMQLHPDDLGLVTVHVEARQGVLSVHIVADHDQARDALRSSLGDLRSHLELSGVRAGDIDVGGDRGTRSQDQARGQQETGQSQSGQYDSRQFGSGLSDSRPQSPSPPDPRPGRDDPGSTGTATTNAEDAAPMAIRATAVNGAELHDAPLDLRI